MNQIEKIIDLATWNRKEHFEHFSAFDDPFFGVTVHVDCTRSYEEAKAKGVSFSLLLLHRIITAASKVEEFRYRIHTIIIRNRVVIAFLFVSLQPFGNCGYQIISKGKEYQIGRASCRERV